MRTLTFAMNVSLDGYVAAPGDDLGWSTPSDELFQWWSDRVGATSVALYGRSATLAAAATKAGLVDEYVLLTAPVLVGGGIGFFTAVDRWVELRLTETRTFPGGVLLTRYETGR